MTDLDELIALMTSCTSVHERGARRTDEAHEEQTYSTVIWYLKANVFSNLGKALQNAVEGGNMLLRYDAIHGVRWCWSV